MKGQAYDEKDRWWGGTTARALGLSEFPGGRGCVFRRRRVGASKDLQDTRSPLKTSTILNRRLLLKPETPNPWTQAPLQAQNVPKPKLCSPGYWLQRRVNAQNRHAHFIGIYGVFVTSGAEYIGAVVVPGVRKFTLSASAETLGIYGVYIACSKETLGICNVFATSTAHNLL